MKIVPEFVTHGWAVLARHWLIASLSGLCAALAAAAAYSPITLINWLVPSDTFVAEIGIAYGPLERQRLDVYRPATAPRVNNAAGAPVIVFFYGGEWASGDRADYLFVGEALASRGFVAVIADYRLYPEVRFPAFLDDSALAVRWAQGAALRLGGDPEQIYLMGHSAGAYNAAMLALNQSFLERDGAGNLRIRGLIGLAGPYDFLPIQRPVSRRIFGYPDTSRRTQPIEFVTPSSPPTLLISVADDDVVDPGNSRRLAERLLLNHVAVKVRVYPNLGHGSLVGALATPLSGLAPVLNDITGFIRSGQDMAK